MLLGSSTAVCFLPVNKICAFIHTFYGRVHDCIYENLKVVFVLFGYHKRFSKSACFLLEWGSRAWDPH